MDIVGILETQLNNQFASGAVIAVLLGSVVALFRNAPKIIGRFLLRLLVVRVDVTDHDPAFYWLQTWLSKHPYTSKSKLLTAATGVKAQNYASLYDKVQKPNEIQFSPAPGWHMLWNGGLPFVIWRDRKESEGTMGEVAYRETFTLATFTRKQATKIMQEARVVANPDSNGTVAIYRRAKWVWLPIQRMKPRSLDSIVLKDGYKEGLVEDIQEWKNSFEEYRKFGVPYRRHYLFSGPPGTGKTSLAIAIAGHFGFDIYVVNLSNMHDESLQEAFDEAPADAILLLEDIDCMFDGREAVGNNKDNNKDNSLTFSGLINCIDGAASKEGRVLVMTTNHPEKLDPALIRPGRVDVQYCLDNATYEQAKNMFLRFFPEEQKLAEEFAAAAKGHSPAKIQEHFLRHKNNKTNAALKPVSKTR